MSYDEFEMPESTDVSNFLNAEGWFHFLVTKVDLQPTNRDNKPIAGRKIFVRVLAGTDASQKGAMHNEIIGEPSLDHKDGGKFKNLVKARAAISMNLIDPNAKGRVQIDWNRIVGQTFVAKISKNDEGYCQIDGAHFYHVNDEAVKDVPKDVALIHSGQQSQPQAAPQQPVQQPAQQQNFIPPGYAPQQQMPPQGQPGYPPQQPVQQPVQQQPQYQQPVQQNGQQPVGLDKL